MSLAPLEFAKEEHGAKSAGGGALGSHFSRCDEPIFSDWEEEDDDDEGWSYRSRVEQEEEEEQPIGILEMNQAP